MAAPLKLASQRAIPRMLVNNVRYVHRAKKPLHQPMERRVFEAITKPILPKPPTWYIRGSCRDPTAVQNRPEEKNLYEEFLLREFGKLLAESQMIVICHRLPCTNITMRQIGIDLKLKGMKLSILNNKHMRLLIADTDKANLAYLLTGDNLIITSPDIKPKEVWNILKRYADILPLGGYLKGRLFTRNQLQDLSKLPSLELLLGELVSCLNLAGGARTSSRLSSHQQTLSINLQQLHKQKSEES